MRFWWCFGLGKLHAIRHSREGEVAWGEARLICYLGQMGAVWGFGRGSVGCAGIALHWNRPRYSRHRKRYPCRSMESAIKLVERFIAGVTKP